MRYSVESFRPAANHCSSADISHVICSDSRLSSDKFISYADGIDPARHTDADFFRGFATCDCADLVRLRDQRGGSHLLVQSRKEEQRAGRNCCRKGCKTRFPEQSELNRLNSANDVIWQRYPAGRVYSGGTVDSEPQSGQFSQSSRF